MEELCWNKHWYFSLCTPGRESVKARGGTKWNAVAKLLWLHCLGRAAESHGEQGVGSKGCFGETVSAGCGEVRSGSLSYRRAWRVPPWVMHAQSLSRDQEQGAYFHTQMCICEYVCYHNKIYFLSLFHWGEKNIPSFSLLQCHVESL